MKATSGVTRSLSIIGTGMYVPEKFVSSSEVDKNLGRPEGFSLKLSGPNKRHVLEEGSSSSMAAKAAYIALKEAGLEPSDINLIISASAVSEQPIPSQAALVARHIGLSGSGIPAYDINATCLSFLAAIDTISDSISAGRYKHVLVISSEVASRGLNWDDPVNAVLFGDGAAAAILRTEPEESDLGIISSLFETYSEGAYFCQLRSGGTALRSQHGMDKFLKGEKYEMDGVSAYKLTAKVFPDFLKRLLNSAKLGMDEIDLVIPHQASAAALDHLVSLLEIPTEKIVNIYGDYGNQIAASLPTALHIARATGKMKDGMTVLLAGTGAGITLGGMVIKV